MLWKRTPPIRHRRNTQIFPCSAGSVASWSLVMSTELIQTRSKAPTTCAVSAMLSFVDLKSKWKRVETHKSKEIPFKICDVRLAQKQKI